MDTILEIVMLVVVLAAVYGLVLWANKATTDRSANVGLYLLYGIPGILLVVAGLALVVNGHPEGPFVLTLGLSFTLPLLKPFRRLMASFTPMDPDSPIDMMGLGIVFSLMTYFAYALSVESGDGNVTPAVTIVSQVINVLFFVLVAFVAVGTWIYRSPGEARARLGIGMPSVMGWLVGIGSVIPAFALSILGSALTLYFQPDVFGDLGDTMEQMSSGTNLVGVNLVLFASAGIGEEILFRGAIQPRFGIVLTAAFWALVHTQYQFSFVVLGLFLVGILFGLIRKYMGTTSAIIAHALYNAIVVLLQAAG